ncbi:uncharacterized protein LOC113229425 [Hyposmocoma kahamanoa]|uniref:uncharacterized protein LOC113229425 n=1 Tax=Hyposmocoma kahamanoa TaxID=1477025 RepID=UPI000E6D9BFC|nr:uncharacterized protein LOC113229425 [Hyposmocoma kahamanoa]
MRVLFLLCVLYATAAKRNVADKLDRYIVSCRTTDFECFRRQYRELRDNVLMGNDLLNIPTYEPYTFKYGDSGTCIKLMGLEDSELTGYQLDSISKELIWTIQLPFRIQQVMNDTVVCTKPDNALAAEPHTGPLKKFLGNATIQVTYPYRLKKKKGELMMSLQDENLDVILDIPDLSHYNSSSGFERNLYEMSEWAYSVVQHIDAAQHFALPYTSQTRTLMEFIPLNKFILLYPEEEYVDLQFKFVDSQSNSNNKCY